MDINQTSLMGGLLTLIEKQMGTTLHQESYSYYFNKRREEIKENSVLSLNDLDPDRIPLSYAEIKAQERDDLDFIDELEEQFNQWNENSNPVTLMVNDLIDRECSHKTVIQFRTVANRFMRMFDHKPNFTHHEVREFLNQYRNNPPSTRKAYREVLKLLWDVQGLAFPLKQRRMHTPHEITPTAVPSFTARQIAQIIKKTKANGTDEEKYYLCMATVFAPRRIELAEITASNFTWSGQTGTLTFNPHKHGLLRVHHIPKELTPFLKEYSYKARHISGTLLTHRFWSFDAHLKLHVPKLSHEEIRRLRAKRLRPRQYGWHAFRHGLITTFLEAGISDTMVNRWLGWRSGSSASPMVSTYYTPQDLDPKVQAKHPFIKLWAKE